MTTKRTVIRILPDEELCSLVDTWCEYEDTHAPAYRENRSIPEGAWISFGHNGRGEGRWSSVDNRGNLCFCADFPLLIQAIGYIVGWCEYGSGDLYGDNTEDLNPEEVTVIRMDGSAIDDKELQRMIDQAAATVWKED